MHRQPYDASVPGAAPPVSVIIPTFNQAAYLPEAIESVLAQDYPDLELIVVDDGSTDETPEVIASYRDQLTHIRQDNQGAAAALNAGLRVARGEMICWLSSDDAFLPGKIGRQVATLVAYPAAGLCSTGWETIDAEGHVLRRYLSMDWVHPDQVVSIFWRNTINGTTVMIPKAVLDEVGPFDERMRADADGDMWLRIADHREIVTLPEVLARYRVHAGAQTRDRKLVQTWKTEVRMPWMRSGNIARRVRRADGKNAPVILALIGEDLLRQGLPRLSRSLLVASVRSGIAPREQLRLFRSLVGVKLSPALPRVRSTIRRMGQSGRRVAARLPGARRTATVIRGRRPRT
jgi:glycosyltransferase involved in cell wall biosynthesis